MRRALGSLTNRIFLGSALLAAASIGAAMYFVGVRLTAEAEAELQRDLREAASLVDQQRAALFDTFTLTARLIADLPTFKAAIDTGDAPTVTPIAEGYRRQAGADVFVVTGATGVVLAAVGERDALDSRLETTPGIARALAGETSLAFWPHPRGVLQFVTVPVLLGPSPLGTLSVGYLLDAERARQFKAVTGADVAFALDGAVRASTLDAASHDDLAALVARGAAARVTIAGSEYAALVQPLRPPDDVNAAAEVPAALILRSRTERMRTLSAIQTTLAGLALVTVAGAIAVSYGVARSITRPLASLTAHMREVAATGDLTRQVPATAAPAWNDEDARVLTHTFNTLIASVARFQREAAQRERLSSLGRMSTVVAHEIRNPLMIIKGALRSLTRADATDEERREAVQDIDEEVARLNRVVHEVLDFARPIAFTCADTDVNDVCRSAAAAAVAEGAVPGVALRLAPALPRLRTDGERLRTVVVNLLSNARQAVDARADGRAPDVVLETAPAEGGRVAIVVRDQGVGITADDLPRIFDPYFTTRRTGAGLGLPLARNVVEGLGGGIEVESRPGAGTDVRVEIGHAPGGDR